MTANNNVDALEASVEQTRQDIASTLTALQARMQPSTIFADTRDAVLGGAQNAATQAETAVNDLLSAVQQHLPNTPLAAAALGAVVAWLGTLGQNAGHAAAQGLQSATANLQAAASDATDHARQGADQLAAQVRDRVAQAADDLQHNAAEAATRAQTQIGAEFAQLEQLLGKNAWLIGALALGIGIAIGVALPETDQERVLYSQARDAVGSQVQSTVHGVLGALSPLTHATTPAPPAQS